MRKIISKVLTKLYDLPFRKIAVYNGVAVRNARLLDKKDTFPEHEKELIEAIRKYVSNNDRVVLIGGGRGASSVVAAHQVGNSGRVIVIEALKSLSKQIQNTITLNKVSEIVNVQHAIVERSIHLKGNSDGAEIISAKNLPECDVLVMDCEGAELYILQNIAKKPQKIIVETHSHFGSTADAIKKILNNLDYEIVFNKVRSQNISILVGILH